MCDAYELRRGGQRLRLARQPMDLLLLLLSRPRELVTREHIANRLWEPGVHTDVDAGIHTGILRIRQVLGDPREAPRFVETVPGKGYRFIAPVQLVDDRDRSAPLLKTSQGSAMRRSAPSTKWMRLPTASPVVDRRSSIREYR